MSELPRRELTSEPHPLVETVPVDAPDSDGSPLAEGVGSQVFIDVIHDGHYIPDEFLTDADGESITLEKIRPDYVRERDWGACLVAARLAQSLGLGDYSRVNVARVLMDFARFPGSTPRKADHLHRFAINYPFSELLSYHQKKQVLEEYYDRVSQQLESRLAGRLMKIAIHTYDQYNESGTERPATSLMTRTIGYQTESEMPAGLFDPMYPDLLAEFTSDRVLRDRISLTLEKRQIPVAHNYPYCLPEGSLEVRYQVWAFFRALRDAYESEHPESRSDPSYAMVWEMLLDTNLRSSESEMLRSYLHMYRRAPVGREEEFERAADAYQKVHRFCHRREDVVERYRFSPLRTSSIAIEVRKDLVSELGEDGVPVRVKQDNVKLIADALAKAVCTYFRDDRTAHDEMPAAELERHDPWYPPTT